MTRRRSLLASSALALLLGAGAPRADAADAPTVALPPEAAAAEAKALLALARSAVKEDFRRQAWWIATRILAADPRSREAADVKARWTPSELALGRRPSKSWASQRDAVLGKAAEAWIAKAKEAASAGPASPEAVAAWERALSFGPKSAEPRDGLGRAERAWAGAWGSVPRKELEQAFGDRLEAVRFEPPMEDDVLEVLALWPEARVVRLGDWRLFTAGDLAAAARALVLLAEEERDFVARFGSHAKPPRDADEDTATDLLLVADAETYDRLAPLLFAPQGRASNPRWEGASGYFGPWQRRILVLERDRDNPWTPPDANLLAWGARGLIKRHLAPDAGGGISGRGTSIVDGAAALYAGFRVGEGGATLEPALAWHLAVAKALQPQWIPWTELLDMDLAAADAGPRPDAEVVFGGEKRKGVRLPAVTAQFAALAAGVVRSDPKQGWKRLGALLEETCKRDRLPDLEKALGGKARAAYAGAVQATDETAGN